MMIKRRAVPRGNPSDGRDASTWGGERSWLSITCAWSCSFSHVFLEEEERRRKRNGDEGVWRRVRIV
jgi:hypothetical protein